MVLVIVGVAAAALGGMLYAAASSPSAGDNRDVLSGLGLLLLIAGIPSFSIGLLVEFFSIGTSLRSLARSSDATLSLLISRSHPGSEIQNSESPSRPAA
jgi:hypothetical protein